MSGGLYELAGALSPERSLVGTSLIEELTTRRYEWVFCLDASSRVFAQLDR